MAFYEKSALIMSFALLIGGIFYFSVVARIVAQSPTQNEFFAACTQVARYQTSDHQALSRGASGVFRPSVSSVSYQRREYPAGSSVTIFSVNEKYGSALKLSGITIRIGAIRNRNTSPQITR